MTILYLLVHGKLINNKSNFQIKLLINYLEIKYQASNILTSGSKKQMKF